MKTKEEKKPTCSECHYFKKGGCPDRNAKAKTEACGGFTAREQGAKAEAMAAKPKFIRSEMVRISMLEPHPDAMAFWASHREKDVDEDSISLSGNVEEMGIMEPLMVVPHATGHNMYWIVDGCSRYIAAKNCGLDEVPCSVYEMDLDLVRTVAYGKNACRHRVTTGERVMRYLDLNRIPVLKAWEAGQETAKRGPVSRDTGEKPNAVSRDTARFDSHAIARRLGCSPKDVLKGIELLASLDAGGIPKKDSYGRVTIIPCEEPMQAAVRHCFASVMAGSTPIRRWNAALKGKTATEDRERAATDYGALMNRSCVSLSNCFENWEHWYDDQPGQKKIEFDLKAKIFETSLKNMLEQTPEQVREYALKIWGINQNQAKRK
jgi:hypothetical protein